MMIKRTLLALSVLALLAVACGDDGDQAVDGTAVSDTDVAPSGADQQDGRQDGAAEADAPEAAADDTSTDAADTAESEPDGAAEEVAAEDVADAAESAGRFVYASAFPFVDLDPSSAFSAEHIVLQNVYETLTRFNPPGSSELLSPGLAVEWESNDDATAWTFTLRDGVTFHDGSPFNAEAVRASLQRTIDLGLGAAFIFLPVESMEVVDDLTISFALAWPAPLDLVMSSSFAAYIMSPDSAAQDSQWFNGGNGAGTGPYTIESVSPNENVILARHDGYWGGWSDGQFDEVELRIVEDPVLAEQMIRSGDADFTFNLPFDAYPSLEQDDSLAVVRGLSMTNLFGLLNNVRLSADVREALVHSFPYDDVVDNLYGGEATRAVGPVPQTMWGAATGASMPQTDLDRASEILSGAGVQDLSLTYSYDVGEVEQEQIGEVWKANLASIGVDLVLEPLTWDARWEIAQGDPASAQDVFTMFWYPTYVTPTDFLYSLYRSEDAPFFNLGYYSNPDFDALLDAADATSGTDTDAASDMFRQAQQILIEDNAAVFMLDVPSVSVIGADITGYTPNPAYEKVVWFYDLRRTG